MSSATAAFPRMREIDSCCITTLKEFLETFQILVNIMETVAQNIKTHFYFSYEVQVVWEEKKNPFIIFG